MEARCRGLRALFFILTVWAAACLSANLAFAASNTSVAKQRPIRVVTDDNMVPEWREVLRFQEPP